MSDLDHGLERFLSAQEAVYGRVLDELRGCRKRSHWMWFVFPQMRGLGSSEMASFYGIASLAEARAYLGHRVLGRRLRECTGLVMECENASVGDIFGSPDDMKFRSSMTLFDIASGTPDNVFRSALAKLCAGMPDDLTIRLTAEPGRAD